MTTREMPPEHIVFLRSALSVILLLWSAVIGIDPPWSPGPEGPRQPVKAEPPREASRERSTRPAFSGEATAVLDRRAFLASFERQAARDLLSCLRAWRPAPMSLALTAELSRNGRLNRSRPLEGELPACAETALAAMDFRPLTTKMTAPSVVIEWRIDW